jgi:mono/diheme cytochrome c family protein/uncharacterized membrane protein
MMNFRYWPTVHWRSLRTLVAATLCLLVLASIHASGRQQPTPKEQTHQKPDKKPNASSLYSKHCQKCHGQDGTGADGRETFPEIPDFTNEKWQKWRSDAELVSTILDGKGTSMPQFANKLGMEEAKALAGFVRSFGSAKIKPMTDRDSDFDKQLQDLFEEMKGLREEFQELSTTPESPQGAAPGPAAAVKKENPATTKPSATSALFRVHCLKCHGKDGKGGLARKTLPHIPDFTDASWQKQQSDRQLATSILKGKEPDMPAFRGKINHDQARELVAEIRALGGGQQGTGASAAGNAQEESRPQGPSRETVEAEQEQALPEKSFFRQLMPWLGKFHPSIVHFPIGLSLAAAVAELLLLGTGRMLFDSTSRVCVWFGGLTAAPAATLGWFLGGPRLTDPSWVLTVHRWLGTSTAACAVVVLFLSELSRRPRGPPRGVFRLALLLYAMLVLLTGFFGGALIHGVNYYAWPPQTAAPGIPSTK